MTPSSPRPKRDALFAALAALLLGVALAFLLERFDRRVADPDTLIREFSEPLLGVVPHFKSSLTTHEGALSVQPAVLEAARTVRANISLARFDSEMRTLLVTSSIAGEGKSSLVLALGLAYRDAGADVVIVEADLRRPSMAAIVGPGRGGGLTRVLSGDADLEGALLDVGSADGAVGKAFSENGIWASGRLRVLHSGPIPPNPVRALESSQFAAVIDRLGTMADVVLLDTAPLVPVSDTWSLLGLADGVVLVGRLGHVTRDVIRRLRQMLDRLGDATILGVVANDASLASRYASTYAYKARPDSRHELQDRTSSNA